MPAFARLRPGIELALVGLLVGVACWAGVELTRHSGRVASIWLANGLLLGILLGAPGSRWMRYLLAGFVGNLASNLLTGDPGAIGLSLAACNSLEVVIAASLIRHCLGAVVDLRQRQDLLVFAAFGVCLAPALSGLLAAIVLQGVGGATALEVFAAWFPADALGIGAMTPLVLALQQGGNLERLRRSRWRLLRSALPLVLVAAVIGWLGSLPLLYLTFPPLLFLVYREGLDGAVLGMLVLVLMTFGLAAAGLVPELGSHDFFHGDVLLIQGYVATASAVALTKAAQMEQRQQLLRELRDAERLQRAVIDHTPALIARVDADRRISFANEKLSKVLRIPRQELIGRRLGEVMDERRIALAAPFIDRVLSGETVVFESSAPSLGDQRHYQSSYVPDFDADGRVQGFYTMSFDITERKLAELAHAAGEERLRTIADNLPVLIAYLDASRVVLFCNSAYETLLGVSPRDLLGRRLDESLPPALYEPQRYFLDCALNGARSEGSFEVEARGGRRYLQVNFLPDLDEAGAVRGVYALTMDVTPLKRVEQQLRQLARFDTLTGLANRREFGERLAAALARSRRVGNTLAVLFLDIDHFKKINDGHGHGGGDEVLQEVALRIRSAVRQTDTVARFAGDEFVILLDQLQSSEEPLFVARKIVAAMERPFVLDSGQIKVSVSVGIAMDAERRGSVEELMQRADRALYAAKNAGRNTFRLADS